MKSRRSLIVTGLAGLLLLGPGAALGQAPSAAADSAEPPPAPPPAKEVGDPHSPHGRIDRASDFAPAGVILDHTHRKGDWTFFYQYMRESHDGLLDDSSSVSAGDVFDQTNYTTLPDSMLTQRHTVGFMYAPINRLTFSLWLPYIEKEMTVEDVDGTRRTDESNGIGDARLMFLIPFITKGKERTQFNVGLSFPTGSVTAADAQGDRLPYTMQLGSGSWDIFWGITYAGQYSRLSWGTQFEGLYRLSDNSQGYKLGTVYNGSAWFATSWSDWMTTSVRMVWTRTGNVRGADPFLDATKATNPLDDNKRQAGTRLDLGPGVNILLPIFGRQRLTFEVIWPIYQNLDGPQLAAEIRFVGGWQWIF